MMCAEYARSFGVHIYDSHYKIKSPWIPWEEIEII